MKLILVVPCYNECEALEDTTVQLTGLFDTLEKNNKISSDSAILYVDDGSEDNTWDIIKNMNSKYKWISGLHLAANVGHQNALYAGLMQVKDACDITISIDADLQDDISVLEEMINEYEKGNDIVFGVRNDRSTDSFFKRFTAQGFYKIMAGMGVRSVYNHADFRLMSARAVRQLSCYKERNLFLRGIVLLIGYSTSCVYYARKERTAGKSKYPLRKMINFAFDGITSFSVKPISLIIVLGLLTICIAIIIMVYSFIRNYLGYTVSGWTSLIISIWFIGGVQLLSLGVIGQYIGKIFVEVKERPRYHIAEYLEPGNGQTNEL